MTPWPSWRSGLPTAFNFKKSPGRKRPGVASVAAESGTESALQGRDSWSRTSGPQGAVAFHPLAQRQALQCDNIAFAPASLLHQKIRTGPSRADPDSGVVASQCCCCQSLRTTAVQACQSCCSSIRCVCMAPWSWRTWSGASASWRRKVAGLRDCVGAGRRRPPQPHLSQAPGPRPGRQSPGSPAAALGAQSADAGADAGWYGARQTTGSRVLWRQNSPASPPATAGGLRQRTRRDVVPVLRQWPPATRRAGR